MSYNIFSIINHLYTDTTIKWLNEIEDKEIQPYLIQRWLCMNDNIKEEVRWLDKYAFSLPVKMYLSLAWSVIPKTSKCPFIKYIKKEEQDEEYDFILKKIIKHHKMSDNDLKANKELIIRGIKNNPKEWLEFYGIDKAQYKKLGVEL